MKRSPALELMDQPELVSREEMVGALDGLRRVNRLLGGVSALLHGITPLLAKAGRNTRGASIRLCDIGTGAGDLPLALARHARRRRIPLQIIAVELNPDLAASAARNCRAFPEIHVVCADARELLRASARGVPADRKHRATPGAIAPATPFDLVTASLFLHHFPPSEVTDWLGLMDAAARVGWVVNDLERHPLAWLGIKLVGPLLSGNRVFLNDAPLSVRRAYTPTEWLRFARDAGASGATLTRRWPWRVVMRRG
jgi:hypothetical protein